MSTDIILVGLRIDGVELDIQTLVDLQTDARSDLEDIFPRLAEAENRGANNRWRIENIEIGIALLPTLIATSIGESSAILEGSIGSIEIALNAARGEAEAARLLAERTERRYNETRTYIDDTSFAARQEIQNRFQNDLFDLQDTVQLDFTSAQDVLAAELARIDNFFQEEIFDLKETVDINVANANTRITTNETEIINEKSARAEMVNALEATYFTETQQVKAESLTSYYTAVAADQAIANSVSDLRSTFIGPDDQIKASVLSGYYTKADTDSALSGVQLVLNSQIEGNKTDAEESVNAVSANLTQNYYTSVATDAAIASAKTILQSNIDGVSANLTENYLTKVGSNSALSILETSLQSEIATVGLSAGTAQTTADNISANLTTNYMTSVETGEAITTAKTELQSDLGDLSANVTNNYLTKTDTEAAIATTQLALNTRITSNDVVTAAAQAAADAANAFAGTKGKVLVQSETPAAADSLSQNLWIDTTGGNNTPKRWSGSSWVAVTDKAATDAAAAASAAQTTANTVSANLTNNYYTKVSTDSAIAAAQTTLQASIDGVSANIEENYQTKVESGSAVSALEISLQSEIETVATDKATQAANIINSNLTTNYYTSAETDGAISASQTTLQANITSTDIATTAAQNAADAASAFAGTKGKVLVQSATPAAADRLSQNLWIDITSGNNTPKRWTSSSWAAVTDKAATDAAAAAAAALLAANSVSATLTNDYYTKVSTDLAISSAETRLGADIGEVSASVTTQGSAIVDLQEGQAAGSSVAGYLIKAQAGGAVSLIDLVASNDGVTEAYSIIKIAADDIILEGSVTADSLGVKSVIAEKIGVDYLSAIATDIGVVTAGVIRSTDGKFQINLDAKTITITV